MINLNLTSNEWFVLYTHIDNLLKQYPDSRYLNSIALKLAENCPKISEMKSDIEQEYECIFGREQTK